VGFGLFKFVGLFNLSIGRAVQVTNELWQSFQ
jgi:hypothetical protein